MKKECVLILIALLASGCSKHHEDGTPRQVGMMPLTGVTSVTKYGGSIVAQVGCTQTCKQTVFTNADVAAYPYDRIDVYLCRNTDCSSGVIPTTTCAEVWNDPTAVCYTTTPSTQIVFKSDIVQFVNTAPTQSSLGYNSYFIQTTVTR